MSITIKQAIEALKSRVADAYTAIVAKGGTLPATQDSANLPSAIASIPSGVGMKIRPTSLSFDKSTQTYDIVLADYVDTSQLTSMSRLFSYTRRNSISLVGCDTSHVTSMYAICADSYDYTHKFQYFSMEGCDTSRVTSWSYAFNSCMYLLKMNIVGCSFASATNLSTGFVFDRLSVCTSLIGDYTLDDVLNNNIKVLVDAKVDITFTNSNRLNRASLRAIINGIADLTGQTARTLNIGATNLARLTTDDIAIATNKNWTIA